MAALQAPGIGSGLDINGIVSQLMQLERQPITRLQQQIQSSNAQLSAFGQLKSRLADFQTAMNRLSTPTAFAQRSTTLSNPTIASVTTSATAVSGNFELTVSQLAERDKIASAAFANGTSVLGAGDLTLSVGDAAFTVTLAENATLADLRDAINAAPDNSGITATLINANAGTSLVLTSNLTGAANTISLSGDFASLRDGFTTVTAARDAEISVDGLLVSRADNRFEEVIAGVSITAQALGTTSVSIARDEAAVLANVKSFATAFNALRTELGNQRKGQLEADSTLLSIERALSNSLSAGTAIGDSNFAFLVQIGISIDKNGVMQVDEAQVRSALQSDFASVSQLFADPQNGIAKRLANVAQSFIANNGPLAARETGLKSRVSAFQDQITRIEDRLVLVESRLRSQFSTLDTLVNNLNATGNFLVQQLQNMPIANLQRK